MYEETCVFSTVYLSRGSVLRQIETTKLLVGTRRCHKIYSVVQVVQAIAAAGEVAMAREYAEAFGMSTVAGFDLSDDALSAAAARYAAHSQVGGGRVNSKIYTLFILVTTAAVATAHLQVALHEANA